MGSTNIKTWERYWLLCSLGLWTIQIFLGLSYWHWQNPPFFFVGADNSQWLFHLSFLNPFLLSSPLLCLCLSALFFIVPLVIFKKPNWLFLRYILLFLWLHYYLTFNALGGHHSHVWLAPILLSLGLCFPKQLWFRDWLRNYACFALLAAGLWKLSRGSVWEWYQMQSILISQHAELLATAPESLDAQWIRFWILHPDWAAMLWYGACILELAFVVGFFTKRWDFYLVLGFIGFFVCDALLMHIYFYPWLAMVLFFYPREEKKELQTFATPSH